MPTQTATTSEHLVLAFADALGWMKACAARGDAAAFAMLADYYALAARAAEEAGGRVIKGIGDGVLMTFPVDNAKAAVAALRRFQGDANARLRAFDEGCRVRVKIGAGRVECGMLGAPGNERYDIIGDALNRLVRAPWTDFAVMPEVAAMLDA